MQEHFIVFDLDVRHCIITRRTVHIGTLTGVETHPREIFRDAIRNAAATIIVAHNHPSGDLTPSTLDVELTRRLRSASELVGIPILDHLVVSAEGYCSFAERDWFECGRPLARG
jgi:DNA repair protein RadC